MIDKTEEQSYKEEYSVEDNGASMPVSGAEESTVESTPPEGSQEDFDYSFLDEGETEIVDARQFTKEEVNEMIGDAPKYSTSVGSLTNAEINDMKEQDWSDGEIQEAYYKDPAAKNAMLAERQSGTTQAMRAVGGGLAKGTLEFIEQTAYIADVIPLGDVIDEALTDVENKMVEFKDDISENNAIYSDGFDAGWWAQGFQSTIQSLTSNIPLSMAGLGAARGVVGALGMTGKMGSFTTNALTAIASNHAETMLMANQLEKETYKKLISNGIDTHIAKEMAAQDKMDMSIANRVNIFTDFAMLQSLSPSKGVNSVIDGIKAEGIKGVAKNMASEGIEEFGQDYIQNEIKYDTDVEAKLRKDDKDAIDRATEYAAKEGWQSAFWGAIGGPFQGAVMQGSSNAKNYFNQETEPEFKYEGEIVNKPETDKPEYEGIVAKDFQRRGTQGSEKRYFVEEGQDVTPGSYSEEEYKKLQEDHYKEWENKNKESLDEWNAYEESSKSYKSAEISHAKDLAAYKQRKFEKDILSSNSKSGMAIKRLTDYVKQDADIEAEYKKAQSEGDEAKMASLEQERFENVFLSYAMANTDGTGGSVDRLMNSLERISKDEELSDADKKKAQEFLNKIGDPIKRTGLVGDFIRSYETMRRNNPKDTEQEIKGKAASLFKAKSRLNETIDETNQLSQKLEDNRASIIANAPVAAYANDNESLERDAQMIEAQMAALVTAASDPRMTPSAQKQLRSEANNLKSQLKTISESIDDESRKEAVTDRFNKSQEIIKRYDSERKATNEEYNKAAKDGDTEKLNKVKKEKIEKINKEQEKEINALYKPVKSRENLINQDDLDAFTKTSTERYESMLKSEIYRDAYNNAIKGRGVKRQQESNYKFYVDAINDITASRSQEGELDYSDIDLIESRIKMAETETAKQKKLNQKRSAIQKLMDNIKGIEKHTVNNDFYVSPKQKADLMERLAKKRKEVEHLDKKVKIEEDRIARMEKSRNDLTKALVEDSGMEERLLRSTSDLVSNDSDFDEKLGQLVQSFVDANYDKIKDAADKQGLEMSDLSVRQQMALADGGQQFMDDIDAQDQDIIDTIYQLRGKDDETVYNEIDRLGAKINTARKKMIRSNPTYNARHDIKPIISKLQENPDTLTVDEINLLLTMGQMNQESRVALKSMENELRIEAIIEELGKQKEEVTKPTVSKKTVDDTTVKKTPEKKTPNVDKYQYKEQPGPFLPKQGNGVYEGSKDKNEAFKKNAYSISYPQNSTKHKFSIKVQTEKKDWVGEKFNINAKPYASEGYFDNPMFADVIEKFGLNKETLANAFGIGKSATHKHKDLASIIKAAAGDKDLNKVETIEYVNGKEAFTATGSLEEMLIATLPTGFSQGDLNFSLNNAIPEAGNFKEQVNRRRDTLNFIYDGTQSKGRKVEIEAMGPGIMFENMENGSHNPISKIKEWNDSDKVTVSIYNKEGNNFMTGKKSNQEFADNNFAVGGGIYIPVLGLDGKTYHKMPAYNGKVTQEFAELAGKILATLTTKGTKHNKDSDISVIDGNYRGMKFKDVLDMIAITGKGKELDINYKDGTVTIKPFGQTESKTLNFRNKIGVNYTTAADDFARSLMSAQPYFRIPLRLINSEIDSAQVNIPGLGSPMSSSDGPIQFNELMFNMGGLYSNTQWSHPKGDGRPFKSPSIYITESGKKKSNKKSKPSAFGTTIKGEPDFQYRGSNDVVYNFGSISPLDLSKATDSDLDGANINQKLDRVYEAMFNDSNQYSNYDPNKSFNSDAAKEAYHRAYKNATNDMNKGVETKEEFIEEFIDLMSDSTDSASSEASYKEMVSKMPVDLVSDLVQNYTTTIDDVFNELGLSGDENIDIVKGGFAAQEGRDKNLGVMMSLIDAMTDGKRGEKAETIYESKTHMLSKLPDSEC